MKNLSLTLVFCSFLLASMAHSTSYACSGDSKKVCCCALLIKLASKGYIQGVKKLLESGNCDVNYVNDDGDTALDVATRRGNGVRY